MQSARGRYFFEKEKTGAPKSLARLRKVSQPANPATGSCPCKPSVFNSHCMA